MESNNRFITCTNVANDDRTPLAKFALHYDKLMVDKDVYTFNEITGKVRGKELNFNLFLMINLAGGAHNYGRIQRRRVQESYKQPHHP